MRSKLNYIIFTLFFFQLLITASCSGEPAIEFKEMLHDFGDVKQKQELTHVFTFTNTGGSTLKIEKIKAGWGCTGVLLSVKEVPAGGEGKVKVTLKTGKKKGKIKKSIYVYTNIPENKKVKLKVIANILIDQKDQGSSKDGKSKKRPSKK